MKAFGHMKTFSTALEFKHTKLVLRLWYLLK